MSSWQDKGVNLRKPGQFKDWDEEDFGVPKNGIWFFNIMAMLANAPESAFLVAWDTPKRAKCFGYYESPTACYQALAKNDLRCCYEVFTRGSIKYQDFPTRSPTLAYGDLEWYGVEDSQHLCARENLRRIHTVCETKLGFTPEIYLLCGSRWDTSDKFKNSYHFVIANLWGGTCEDVEQLFLPGTLRIGADDDLKEFDLKVYATCQQYRMPLCTKRGCTTPLRRINTDLRDPDDALTATFPDDDIDAILGALVTVFDKTESTMHLLKPGTLAPAKVRKPSPQAGDKRTHAQISIDATSTTDAHPTYSRQHTSEVADFLVAMHPDYIATHYDKWRDIIFAAIDGAGVQAGAPPEFINMIREFTRPRRAADRRAEAYPRIAAGTFASSRSPGDEGSRIGVKSLSFKQCESPAACTHKRAVNAEPLSDCRALLATEDVMMFDLFQTYLRHLNYQKTSIDWLIQFGSYIVPKLKDQVYETIHGEYEALTKEHFDIFWDGGQSSEIYGYAFRHYLVDIVDDINQCTPPVVTTPGVSGGEATEGGSSTPHEADATVRHVKGWKPKARGGTTTKRFTKEEAVTFIVSTSASVHSLEPPSAIRKAVREALYGQEDADEVARELLDLWALLQGKSSKTGYHLQVNL